MVRVLLVQPPHRDTFGYSMPPLGALHLAATARRRGHEPTFLDLALLLRRGDLPDDDGLIDACARTIVAAEPEVLGLGAMISSLPATLHLAAEVRRLQPSLPILLGGQGPETVEEALIARYPAIDVVAVGEADETLSDVLDVLADKRTRNALAGGAEPSDELLAVPGLVLRRHAAPHRTAARPVLAELDAVDPPAFDLAESPRAYALAAGGDEALFPIDLGRGCSYSCSFCSTPIFWGRSVRYLSPGRAVDALDALAALDGIGCAYVTHDLFTADRQHVLDICAEKIRRGNELPWECRTRIDLVDRELLDAMVAAGCRRILYGVESDSAAVLGAVDKGGKLAAPGFDVRAVLREASDAGMASIVGVMVGVPGENRDDVEANLQLMADAAVIDGCSLSMHWFNVTPGNGQADATPSELMLIPGLHADLVRGHDMPAGQVHSAQAHLIASDPELFAGFRVFAPEWAAPREVYLLTRNAHLLLEVLPRSLRAFAHQRRSNLLDTLLQLLQAIADGDHCDPPEDPEPTASVSAADAPIHGDSAAPSTPIDSDSAAPIDATRGAVHLAAERSEHADPWEELLVLERSAAVRLVSALISEQGDERVCALLSYERALFETNDATLCRFPVDPVPLMRAMDAGRWPPLASEARTGAVLFSRHGDLVRAHTLSDFLADAHELPDDAALLARWPDAAAGDVTRARELLASLNAI
jgi:radical SAM superfamily enzyme YgiQ (UPF0313 family)